MGRFSSRAVAARAWTRTSSMRRPARPRTTTGGTSPPGAPTAIPSIASSRRRSRCTRRADDRRALVRAPGASPHQRPRRWEAFGGAARHSPDVQSEPLDVRQPLSRGLDRAPRLQEHTRCVPGSVHEDIARAVGDGGLDRPAREADLLALDIKGERLSRPPAHLALEPLDVGRRSVKAGHAIGRAVAEEDLAEGDADQRLDAPVQEGLRRVLAGGPTAEVGADHHDRRALVRLLVERVLGVDFAGVLEGVLAQAREGDGFEKARGDDAIGVDVVAGERKTSPDDLPALHIGAHRSISLTSATAPAMAAAATMTGLI